MIKTPVIQMGSFFIVFFFFVAKCDPLFGFQSKGISMVFYLRSNFAQFENP